MISSRKIEDLQPKVQILAHKFIDMCHLSGIDVLITSTYRDKENQDALYAQGRIKDTKGNWYVIGKTITNAKGGQSFHNYAVAFDFVPIINGKPQWDAEEIFRHCGAIAKSIGLEWAGDWISFKEMAHCQYTDGLSLADFQNGKTL